MPRFQSKASFNCEIVLQAFYDLPIKPSRALVSKMQAFRPHAVPLKNAALSSASFLMMISTWACSTFDHVIGASGIPAMLRLLLSLNTPEWLRFYDWVLSATHSELTSGSLCGINTNQVAYFNRNVLLYPSLYLKEGQFWLPRTTFYSFPRAISNCFLTSCIFNKTFELQYFSP